MKILRPNLKLTRFQRFSLVVFSFCTLNALWAIGGDWSISFGGEEYVYINEGSHESGIYSSRGYLVIALRNSFFVGAGVLPPDWETRKPVRRKIPWGIHTERTFKQGTFGWHLYNGILDNWTRSYWPVVLKWEDGRRRWEWYNRGIAIHWVLLMALSALAPTTALIRQRKRMRKGLCAKCGYDMRATPNRCPECGAEAIQSSGQ